eukprot:1160638-Pelagomonas_calceolata.AAC.3
MHSNDSPICSILLCSLLLTSPSLDVFTAVLSKVANQEPGRVLLCCVPLHPLVWHCMPPTTNGYHGCHTAPPGVVAPSGVALAFSI